MRPVHRDRDPRRHSRGSRLPGSTKSSRMGRRVRCAARAEVHVPAPGGLKPRAGRRPATLGQPPARAGGCDDPAIPAVELHRRPTRRVRPVRVRVPGRWPRSGHRAGEPGRFGPGFQFRGSGTRSCSNALRIQRQAGFARTDPGKGELTGPGPPPWSPSPVRPPFGGHAEVRGPAEELFPEFGEG